MTYPNVVESSKHFSILIAYQAPPVMTTGPNYRSLASKYHKIALIERKGSQGPIRIDRRGRHVKTLIVQWNYVPSPLVSYVVQEAIKLMDKLERVWPCLTLSREYREAPVWGAIPEIKGGTAPRNVYKREGLWFWREKRQKL